MIQLKEGDFFATKDLSREQYNNVCESLIKAGCLEGEYQRLPLELPSQGNNPHTKQLPGCYSINYGMFDCVGWRYGCIFHWCGYNFEGSRFVNPANIH